MPVSASADQIRDVDVEVDGNLNVNENLDVDVDSFTASSACPFGSGPMISRTKAMNSMER